MNGEVRTGELGLGLVGGAIAKEAKLEAELRELMYLWGWNLRYFPGQRLKLAGSLLARPGWGRPERSKTRLVLLKDSYPSLTGARPLIRLHQPPDLVRLTPPHFSFSAHSPPSV